MSRIYGNLFGNTRRSNYQYQNLPLRPNSGPVRPRTLPNVIGQGAAVARPLGNSQGNDPFKWMRQPGTYAGAGDQQLPQVGAQSPLIETNPPAARQLGKALGLNTPALAPQEQINSPLAQGMVGRVMAPQGASPARSADSMARARELQGAAVAQGMTPGGQAIWDKGVQQGNQDWAKQQGMSGGTFYGPGIEAATQGMSPEDRQRWLAGMSARGQLGPRGEAELRQGINSEIDAGIDQTYRFGGQVPGGAQGEIRVGPGQSRLSGSTAYTGTGSALSAAMDSRFSRPDMTTATDRMRNMGSMENATSDEYMKFLESKSGPFVTEQEKEAGRQNQILRDTQRRQAQGMLASGMAPQDVAAAFNEADPSGIGSRIAAREADLANRKANRVDRGIMKGDQRAVRMGLMSPMEATMRAMNRNGTDVNNPLMAGILGGPEAYRAAVGAQAMGNRDASMERMSAADRQAQTEMSQNEIAAKERSDKALMGLKDRELQLTQDKNDLEYKLGTARNENEKSALQNELTQKNQQFEENKLRQEQILEEQKRQTAAMKAQGDTAAATRQAELAKAFSDALKNEAEIEANGGNLPPQGERPSDLIRDQLLNKGASQSTTAPESQNTQGPNRRAELPKTQPGQRLSIGDIMDVAVSNNWSPQETAEMLRQHGYTQQQINDYGQEEVFPGFMGGFNPWGWIRENPVSRAALGPTQGNKRAKQLRGMGYGPTAAGTVDSLFRGY